MTYGYVYVPPSIWLGSAQVVKALPSRSLQGTVPDHRLRALHQHGINMAVPGRGQGGRGSRYWYTTVQSQSYRRGKNPFTLDSKPPKAGYKDFIMGEVRYASLTSSSETAKVLSRRREESKEKRAYYEKLAVKE